MATMPSASCHQRSAVDDVAILMSAVFDVVKIASFMVRRRFIDGGVLAVAF
jgi:hypothetical protein